LIFSEDVCMRQHIRAAIASAVVVSAGMFSEALMTGQSTGRGASDQGGRGASASRLEDNRPPVFWREEWNHQFDRGGPAEGPVGQQHVSQPALELKHYDEAPNGDPEGSQEHTHAGMWMNKRFANDPAHLFTGTCNRPGALTLRHRLSAGGPTPWGGWRTRT
jgi:hypothetical protein